MHPFPPPIPRYLFKGSIDRGRVVHKTSSLRLAGSLAFILAATATAQDNRLARQSAQTAHQTMQVEIRQVRSTVPVGGTVIPQTDITFTAQVPGRVEYLAGTEGDHFGEGTVLVALDSEELRAQRQAIEAEIMRAEAAIRDASVQFDRERRSPRSNQNMVDQFMGPMKGMLPGWGTSSRDRSAELHRYGTQLEQARSNLYQAQSKLKEIDARLKDTRSYAPFDGVIIRKMVNVGDTVQPGTPLLQFANLSVLQVQLDAPSRLASGLRVNDTVAVRLDDADGSVVDARVAQIFPVADPTRHTIRIKFDLPRTAPATPGMYAEVLMPDTRDRGERYPVIPRTAIFERGGLPMARVLDKKTGKVRLRLLRLGDEVENGQVVVLTGLRGGETILLGD